MESLVDNIIYEVRDTQTSVASQFLFAAESAVDTFFALSGFLATYLFLDSFAKARNSGKPVREPNLAGWSLLVYFHRYLRLTPLYFIAIMFWTYVLPDVSQGPFWADLWSVSRSPLTIMSSSFSDEYVALRFHFLVFSGGSRSTSQHHAIRTGGPTWHTSTISILINSAVVLLEVLAAWLGKHYCVIRLLSEACSRRKMLALVGDSLRLGL